MKKLAKILIFFLGFIFYSTLKQNTFAQGGIPIGPPPPAPNPLGGIKPPEGIPANVEALGSFLGAIIQLLVIGAGVITLIILIIGGIQYATAGGDPKSTDVARGRITAGIIGLLITLSSFAIIKLIEFFFKIPILKFTLPTF